MPLQFFSPNAKNTGAALSTSFNSKDAAFYFNLIKQVSWNETTKTGSFKGGAMANIKFSPDEAGGFIETVRTKGESKFFHSFGDETSSGNFRYYCIENPKGNKEGFGLTVKKGDTEWKVGFSLGSAERLMEHLKFGFEHIFSAIYAADKKAFETRMADKPKPVNKPVDDEPADQEPEQKTNEPDEDF